MAILKKGSITGTDITNLNLSNINLVEEKKVDNIKFNKEEYIALLDEAKKTGYEEGLSLGYKEGYDKGLVDLEKSREQIANAIQVDKESLSTYLLECSAEYLNNFQKNILDLVSKSVNKIFLDCIKDEVIISNYLITLLESLLTTHKSFQIEINDSTYQLISVFIEEKNIKFDINDSLDNYSVLVITSAEKQEYFLENEFEKIKELFNS